MNIKKILKLTFHFFKIIFLLLFLISLFLYSKPFITAEYLSQQEIENIEQQSLGFLSNKQTVSFNNKTPRGLFTNFYYKSLSLWMGFHKYYYEVINCISPKIINTNDYIISEQNINIDKILVAILKTNFKLKDIPDTSSSDQLNLTLGHGSNRQTFYIAKKSNGDWYFTSKNFSENKTIDKLMHYKEEKTLLKII